MTIVAAKRRDSRGIRIRLGVVLSLVAVLVTGCASKELIVLLPSQDGKTGEVTVTDAKGEAVTLNEPLAAAEVDGAGTALPVALTTGTLNSRYGQIPAAMPKAPTSYVVFFEFGTSDLTAASQEALDAALEDISQRPGAEVEVIGHTDTVGEAADNDRLSVNRAEVVAAMLRANAVDGSLIRISGRGERELRVYTPDEFKEPRTRRVQITVR